MTPLQRSIFSVALAVVVGTAAFNATSSYLGLAPSATTALTLSASVQITAPSQVKAFDDSNPNAAKITISWQPMNVRAYQICRSFDPGPISSRSCIILANTATS